MARIQSLTTIPSVSDTDVLAIEHNTGTGTYKVPISMLLSNVYSKSEAVAKADIVNNLDSTAINKPLSAAQGNALNESIENLVKIVNATGTQQAVATGNFELTITPNNIPSGYVARGVVGWNIGSRVHVIVTAVQYYSGKLHIFGVNNSGDSINLTPNCNLLCVADL